ncbi:VOC family protein [Streptomyces odontomachi]|uniref:VOC family protein n=1 Tax=Streptomyces odontomachi TaxID=2944940 RepID=UPI00210AFC90|nr:VOC family protein [Streptomyces sp. ODS25]
MAVKPEGTPCWADAMFPDLQAAKDFYGELLGWTFGATSEQYGNYTQAFSGGENVAALSPLMPGWEGPPAWNVYFASPDVDATAAMVSANGGDLLMEPTAVGDFGRMLMARDPSGVVFGVWQAGTHQGFEKQGEPGSYAWVEVTTRDTAKADAFFPAVFGYGVRSVQDEAVDFKVFTLGDDPVAGRMKMTENWPAEVPPYVNVYFAVADCDAAVGTVTRHGGRVHFGPHDSPFGRFAAVSDPQGATLSVIDLGTTEGELPEIS